MVLVILFAVLVGGIVWKRKSKLLTSIWRSVKNTFIAKLTYMYRSPKSETPKSDGFTHQRLMAFVELRKSDGSWWVGRVTERDTLKPDDQNKL